MSVDPIAGTRKEVEAEDVGETFVLLMLIAWLAYTALMTIRSGVDERGDQPANPMRARHVSGGPARAQSYGGQSLDHREG